MNAPTPAKLLSRDEILLALSSLGEDPEMGRVDQLRERIDASTLPEGDRDAAVRAAVDAARLQLDAGAAARKLQYEVISDDVLHVLQTQSLAVANTEGKPFDVVAQEVYDALDFNHVERRMVLAGTAREVQAAAAREAIADQLVEQGVLKRKLPQRSVSFPDRVRFNWGFHDGSAEAERAKVRDMDEHSDREYANGYVRGVLAWKNLGYRPESSDAAWAACQGHPVALKEPEKLPESDLVQRARDAHANLDAAEAAWNQPSPAEGAYHRLEAARLAARQADEALAGQKAGQQHTETRLWVALVEHESVPGTRPVLFAQAREPEDDEILSRFGDDADPAELTVVGFFDLSHVMDVDPASKAALARYVGAAAIGAQLKQDVAVAKVPSVFDTMVPWGENRSPIGPGPSFDM